MPLLLFAVLNDANPIKQSPASSESNARFDTVLSVPTKSNRRLPSQRTHVVDPILIKAPHLCDAQFSGRERYSYLPLPPSGVVELQRESNKFFFIIILSQNFGHQFMFIIFSLYFAFTIFSPFFLCLRSRLCAQFLFINYVYKK